VGFIVLTSRPVSFYPVCRIILASFYRVFIFYLNKSKNSTALREDFSMETSCWFSCVSRWRQNRFLKGSFFIINLDNGLYIYKPYIIKRNLINSFIKAYFDVELHLWFRSRGAGTASRAWCSDTTFAHVVCAAGKYTLLRRGSGNPFPLSCQKVIINHVITYSETNATSSISSSVDRLDVILTSL
jgi:hypothetical protein